MSESLRSIRIPSSAGLTPGPPHGSYSLPTAREPCQSTRICGRGQSFAAQMNYRMSRGNVQVAGWRDTPGEAGGLPVRNARVTEIVNQERRRDNPEPR